MLQAQVDALAVEKVAAVEARDEANSRLAALSAELAEACSELETAQHTGTPKGELHAGHFMLCEGNVLSRSLDDPKRVAITCPLFCHAGEAAKKVSTLAFQRIRELQGAIEDSKLEVAAREERIIQLEQRVAFLEHEALAAQVGSCAGGL